MPLETGDNDPIWAEGYRTSPEEARRARQTWLEAGRRAWNEATRAGRNVAARTESELMALGRAHLEREAQGRAPSKPRPPSAPPAVPDVSRARAVQASPGFLLRGMLPPFTPPAARIAPEGCVVWPLPGHTKIKQRKPQFGQGDGRFWTYR